MPYNLWVVGVASDEATPNRRFYLLHEELDGKNDTEIRYRTQNLFASSRFIFFFAGAPNNTELFAPFSNWTLHPIHVE